MANLNELKDALLHTLAAKGSLGQMKARIRSEIFSALDQSDDSQPRAPLSNTNLLINELIREYMMFNQYRYSLNVFLPETNQPEVPPFDRAFIAQELHVQENQHSVQIPLLYSLIALLQQNKVGSDSSSTGVPIVETGAASSYQPQYTPPTNTHQASSAMTGQQPVAGYGAPPQPQPQRSMPQPPLPANPSSSMLSDAPKPMHFVNRQ